MVFVPPSSSNSTVKFLTVAADNDDANKQANAKRNTFFIILPPLRIECGIVMVTPFAG